MTRHIICREDVVETEVDNTKFELYSLTWDEGRIPVGWQFLWTGKYLLGYAEDLKREDNGEITAEIIFKQQEEYIHSGRDFLGATIYASSVVSKMQNDIKVVSGAKVKGVAITMAVPWRLSDWELETGGE